MPIQHSNTHRGRAPDPGDQALARPLRRRGAVAALITTAAALTAALAGVPAASGVVDEPMGWKDGANTFTRVVNCPSQIFGNPYVEDGIAAKVGYYGDPDSGLPLMAEHYTYLHLVFAGLGNPCLGGTKLWPNIGLPAGVEWYKDAAIQCYWNGSPLTGEHCPQWTSVIEGQGPAGSDVYDHPGDDTWHVSQGGIVELVLPIWAPHQAVHGGWVQAWVYTADGNENLRLTPGAPVSFFDAVVPPPADPPPADPPPADPPPADPPASPVTCQGRTVTVDLRKGQQPTSGSDVVLGTSGADIIRVGTGDDVVCGSGGDDVLRGGDGRDSLAGGNGHDLLAGGSGRDRCSGGRGLDAARGCELRSSFPRAVAGGAATVTALPGTRNRG